MKIDLEGLNDEQLLNLASLVHEEIISRGKFGDLQQRLQDDMIY